jgi:hypothetical protein
MTLGYVISYLRKLRAKSHRCDLVTSRVQNCKASPLHLRGLGAPEKNEDFRPPLMVSFLTGAFLINIGSGVDCTLRSCASTTLALWGRDSEPQASQNKTPEGSPRHACNTWVASEAASNHGLQIGGVPTPPQHRARTKTSTKCWGEALGPEGLPYGLPWCGFQSPGC